LKYTLGLGLEWKMHRLLVNFKYSWNSRGTIRESSHTYTAYDSLEVSTFKVPELMRSSVKSGGHITTAPIAKK